MKPKKPRARPGRRRPEVLSEITQPTRKDETVAPSNAQLDPENDAKRLGLNVPSILWEGDEPTAVAARGPGQKFEVGPPVVAAMGQGEGELPEGYGTGRLWLTPRDPHCFDVHWDPTAEQQRQCTGLGAHQPLAVRVYRESRADCVAEVQVHPGSRHWFIHVEQAGLPYLAELGFYEVHDQWHALALGGPVTGAGEPSAVEASVRFATITEEAPARTNGAAEQHAPATASAQAAWRVEATQPGSGPAARDDTPALLTSELPTGPDVSAIARQIERPTRAPAKGVTVPEWTSGQERALAELIGWTVLRQRWLNSEEILEVLRGEQRRELPGALSSQAAAQLGISSIPGAKPGEISSLPSGAQPGAPGFWLNVNAELVIYGATQPDAQVTIGGRPIRLRPDGTFSYRFALPDGHYELPIEAIAPDGDTRSATLEFFRGTSYAGEVGAHPQDVGLKTPIVEHIS